MALVQAARELGVERLVGISRRADETRRRVVFDVLKTRQQCKSGVGWDVKGEKEQQEEETGRLFKQRI